MWVVSLAWLDSKCYCWGWYTWPWIFGFYQPSCLPTCFLSCSLSFIFSFLSSLLSYFLFFLPFFPHLMSEFYYKSESVIRIEDVAGRKRHGNLWFLHATVLMQKVGRQINHCMHCVNHMPMQKCINTLHSYNSMMMLPFSPVYRWGRNRALRGYDINSTIF